MGVVRTKNHNITIETRKIRHGSRPEFENLFGRYAMSKDYQGINIPVGTIKNLALSKGLKSVSVDGEQLKIDTNDPAKVIDKIDEAVLNELDEQGTDIYNEFLKFVVSDSPWLGRKEPFNGIFQPYMPEHQETEDPIPDT